MNFLKRLSIILLFISLSACSLVEQSSQSANVLSAGNRSSALSVGFVDGSLLTLPFEFMSQNGFACEDIDASCQQVEQNGYEDTDVDILIGLPPAVFVDQSPVINQVWPLPNAWVDPATGQTFIDDELPEGEPKAIFMPNTAVAISNSGEHLTAAPTFLPMAISSKVLIENPEQVNLFLTEWLQALNALHEDASWYFEEGGLTLGETIQSFGWEDTAVLSAGDPMIAGALPQVTEATVENYQVAQEDLPEAWQTLVVPIISADGVLSLTPAALADGVLVTAFPSQALLFPNDSEFIPGGDMFFPIGDHLPSNETLVDDIIINFIPGGDMFVTNSVNKAGEQMTLAIVVDGANYLITHNSEGQLGR